MEKFGYARLFKDDIRFWHKIYFKIFGVSPDHKLRFMYFKDVLETVLNNKRCEQILDAGCGCGDYTFYLSYKYPGTKINAIDIDNERIKKSIETAKKIGVKNAEFKCKNILEVDEKIKYDFIYSIDVLEHISDIEIALNKLVAALNDEGYLYIHLPLIKNKPVILSRYLKEFHEWSHDEHIAEPMTLEKFTGYLNVNKVQIISQQFSFNHYLGELCVSLIMLFYNDNKINNLVKVILTPIFNILIILDFVLKRKNGNALAILVQKRKFAEQPT